MKEQVRYRAVIFLSVISFILMYKVFADYRIRGIVNRPMLHINFEHTAHKEVQCVSCHHNFIDTSGHGICYHCHKYHAEVAVSIEKMFHTFCRDCHMKTKTEGDAAGPVRQCGTCHNRDAEQLQL